MGTVLFSFGLSPLFVRNGSDGNPSDRHSGKEEIHYYKMACASQHNKNMKNFVRAEILMSGVKNRKF